MNGFFMLGGGKKIHGWLIGAAQLIQHPTFFAQALPQLFIQCAFDLNRVDGFEQEGFVNGFPMFCDTPPESIALALLPEQV